MTTREENLKKINDQLDQMSDEQLDQIAGGAELPIIQPNEQGLYPQPTTPQGYYPQQPNQPPYPSNHPQNPNLGSWNQPPQQINYPPGYRPNPVPNPNPGSWNQPPGGYQQQPNWNVPPVQK